MPRPIQIRCSICRQSFHPQRNDARSCSSRCRQKAYRKRLSVTRKANKSVTVNALFSSQSNLWSTPQKLYDELNSEFHFTLDVCASPENAKCQAFYTTVEDGLKQPWSGVCWMNPPYGKAITAWIKKAYESSHAGVTVVCLLPVRTSTRWWQNYVLNKAEIHYLPKRLRFSESKYNAPFSSAVVVFRPKLEPIPNGSNGQSVPK